MRYILVAEAATACVVHANCSWWECSRTGGIEYTMI